MTSIHRTTQERILAAYGPYADVSRIIRARLTPAIAEAAERLADALATDRWLNPHDSERIQSAELALRREAADSVSRDQLERLRSAAASAGDGAQVEICDRALDGDHDARIEWFCVIGETAGGEYR